ncbi:putative armadillo-like helical, importin beta family [Helianthus annuus]|uniref:Armadillo-like helical, importin beta family n=1 Tax=Helianthus annuus TaxID=4232 RepID=A0A251UUM3_HELAN|nr:putative armadillo-like helical, importin beta family [Helianthus annuus]
MAYDNAVSALGKICQFYRDSIDSTHIIPAWLSCLPIKGDLIEAKVVHELLCSMVERSDMELLGPNNQYVPKIVLVFAEHSHWILHLLLHTLNYVEAITSQGYG